MNISATLLFSDEGISKQVRHTVQKKSISFVSAILSFFKWVAIKICHRNSPKKRKKKHKKQIFDLEDYNVESPKSPNRISNHLNSTGSTAFSNTTTSSMRTPEMRIYIDEDYLSPNRDLPSRRAKTKRKPRSSYMSP